MKPETIALFRHLIRLAKGMLTACERYLTEYAEKRGENTKTDS